ncbi:transmembrane protein 276 isoform X2 [Rhineura floridana]|nr:transmembrane protein 276 isoform X2 [Rhineura floridana]
MPGRPDEVAALLTNLLLCGVCLGSAAQTFQINRGAAAGFLLQAVVPLLDTAALLPAPLGLSLESARCCPDDAWVCTVVGLPLLAFGFHWLNGDCSTANVLLGGALLLAGGSDYYSEEGRAMVAHSVRSVASITILIVSVFTGNAYGIVGSLLLGMAELLVETQLQQLLVLRKGDALCGLMAAANLALRWALQMQQRELD